MKLKKPNRLEKPNKLNKPEKLVSVFRKEYADSYDLLYTDKDYKDECDMIEEVFTKYADGPIKSILDLGCGTGNHSIPLAQRGYEVTGVDISSDMLRIRDRRKTYHALLFPAGAFFFLVTGKPQNGGFF